MHSFHSGPLYVWKNCSLFVHPHPGTIGDYKQWLGSTFKGISFIHAFVRIRRITNCLVTNFLLCAPDASWHWKVASMNRISKRYRLWVRKDGFLYWFFFFSSFFSSVGPFCRRCHWVLARFQSVFPERHQKEWVQRMFVLTHLGRKLLLCPKDLGRQ